MIIMDFSTHFPFVLSLISVGLSLVAMSYIYIAERNFTEGKMKAVVQWVFAGVFFLFLTCVLLAVNEVQKIYTNIEFRGVFFLYLSTICFAVAVIVLSEISELYGFKNTKIFKQKTKK